MGSEQSSFQVLLPWNRLSHRKPFFEGTFVAMYSSYIMEPHRLMGKLALIVFITGISTIFGLESGVAAQPKSFTKFLNDMDRNVCRSFKVTCKARLRQRAAKHQKPISDVQTTSETPTTPANSETSSAKSTSAPPIPIQKPVLVPKVVASAPVKAVTAPPTPVNKPVTVPEAAAPVKTVSAPPIPVQKPVIILEAVAPAPIPRAKPQKLQKQAALLPRVLPNDIPPGDDNDICLQKLHAAGVDFTVPAVNVDSGRCQVQNPVNLHSVKAQQNLIKLPESPLFNCKFALQFSKWLSESGAPILAAQLGTPLENISTGPGYECRGRNGEASAKISEHGFGNAVDITTLRMHDGREIAVQDAINPNAANYATLHGLRASACGYFTTVLGPGSNAAHEKHFHFDLGVHGKSGNYRICE